MSSRDISLLELQIRKKNREVEILQRQLEYCQQLLKPNQQKFDNTKHCILHDIPEKHQIIKHFNNSKNDTYFITITFDPEIIQTIGLKTTDLQKQYLISKIHDFHYSLTDSIDHYIKIYGCLEFQKNGTLHAHFIIQFTHCEEKSDYINDLHECINSLKYNFTDNVYNKRAIHWRTVDDLDKAVDYILKEPHTLYKY